MNIPLASLICLDAVTLAGCSNEFQTKREQNTLTAGTAFEEATINWAGMPTFLIDDGRSQELFDGFFSRPDRLKGGVGPDLERIQGSLAQLGVAKVRL